MKRISIVICFFVSEAFAQPLEQVMENYFNKIGGKAKVASIKSSKEISYNWFRRNPEDIPGKNKSIKTMTISKEPYYKRFISFDSKDNWVKEFYYNEKGSVLAMGSVIQKSKDQIQLSISIAADLLEWYREGKLKYLETRSVKGEEYEVISRMESNNIEFFFFNTKTYLLDATQKQAWPDRMKFYKDYHETNLILHPFLEEDYQNEIIFYSQKTEFFEFNPPIDNKIIFFKQKEYEEHN